MPTNQPAHAVIRFGAFELDTRSGELRKKGLKIKLQEQPFLVLAMLLERPGDIVTREELRLKLWPTDTFVDFDLGLNKAINRLRAALGDSADSPRFIETLPRRGYRYIGPSMAVNQGNRTEPAPKVRLAILPLDNLSGDPAQEFFSDGLTEELITQLGGLNPAVLGVIARTSVNKYKRTERTIGEIGRELEVDYVMEGSVRRSKDRVRISAQLIQVSDQMHLWADSYEHDLRDVLVLQNEVARSIAHQIRIQLTPVEEGRLSLTKQVNPAAYDACLQGRYHFSKMSGAEIRQAWSCFEAAAAADPEFAPAYSGIADCFSKFGQFGFVPPKEAYPYAKMNALKAIALDKSLSEAHASLGFIEFLYEWNWAGAQEKLEHAIALNPNIAIIHAWYAFCLIAMGETEKAFQKIQRAISLEPLGTVTNAICAMYYIVCGQYDLGVRQLRKAYDLHPEAFVVQFMLGSAYMSTLAFDRAIEMLEKAVSLSGYGIASGYLGAAYAMSGQQEKAEAFLLELQEKSKSSYIPSLSFALICGALGQLDRVFDWLQRALDERESNLVFLPVFPEFASFRSHPRYQAIYNCMRLKP